ncbi:hypothetical protein ACYSNM_13150 [Myroides sp. LJL116]
MRKGLLFLLLIVGAYTQGQAQTVNGIPLKDLDMEYIQIVGSSKNLSNKVTVELDFGQDTKFFGSKKQTLLTDEKGNKIVFNSMIDALNFLSSHGFEFVQAFSTASETKVMYHYLLRKRDFAKK